MKIDEDLIHEQLENFRDELCFYVRDSDITEEHKEHILSITRKLKGIVAVCKKEQEERDNEHYAEQKAQIARIEYASTRVIERYGHDFLNL